MNRRLHTETLLSIGLLALAAIPASGQVIGQPAQTAGDNVRGGAIRGRNPGQMVQNGVARHSDFADRQSLGTVIDAEETLDPFPGLIAEALEIVFGQINDAIAAFRNLLLVRSGQTPVPASALNTATNTNTNTNNTSSGGRR